MYRFFSRIFFTYASVFILIISKAQCLATIDDNPIVQSFFQSFFSQLLFYMFIDSFNDHINHHTIIKKNQNQLFSSYYISINFYLTIMVSQKEYWNLVPFLLVFICTPILLNGHDDYVDGDVNKGFSESFLFLLH